MQTGEACSARAWQRAATGTLASNNLAAGSQDSYNMQPCVMLCFVLQHGTETQGIGQGRLAGRGGGLLDAMYPAGPGAALKMGGMQARITLKTED